MSDEHRCVLCNSIDNDKEHDHIRLVYYSGYYSSDKFDRSCFVPRGLYSDERAKLQRGFNEICSNRSLCHKRQEKHNKKG